MKLVHLIIAVTLGVVQVAHTQSRQSVLFPDYFSCQGREDGSYPHPNDCTRFILCGNGKARDDPCLWCDNTAFQQQCQGNKFLVYDDNIKQCRFQADAGCGGGEGGGGGGPPPGYGGGGGGYGGGGGGGGGYGGGGGGGGYGGGGGGYGGGGGGGGGHYGRGMSRASPTPEPEIFIPTLPVFG